MRCYQWLNQSGLGVFGVLCLTQVVACGTPAVRPDPPRPDPQAFLAAVKASDLPAIEAALRSGIDPDLREQLRAQWDTPDAPLDVPVLVGVRAGHEQATAVLLKAGADPNQREGGFGWGVTPLMEASRTGKIQFVDLLLRYGANVHLRRGPMQAHNRLVNPATALTDALVNDHVTVVERLLLGGATPGTDDLAHAVARGNTEIAYLLLSAGANAGLVAHSGRNAAQEAALLPDDKRKSMTAMIDEFVRGYDAVRRTNP
jgi:hypothetical protein